jgi:hypothetical protein
MSNDGDDNESGNDRTIQMSPDALAKLHAELAGKRAASATSVPREATVEVEHVEAPLRPRATPPARSDASMPPKPSAKAPAPTGASGGGALIVGGFGALIAALGPGLLTLTNVQGMGGAQDLVYAGFAALVLGHLLSAIGMFGAVSRTNGLAALVGTFHLLTSLAVTLVLLTAFRIVQLDSDLSPLVVVVSVSLLGCSWLLSAIWGFSALGRMGALGVLHGIFAMIGGAAVVTLGVGKLAGLYDSLDDDLAIALVLSGAGGILLGAIFLAVGKFGRLRRS